MKFNCLLKTTILIILISFSELHQTGSRSLPRLGMIKNRNKINNLKSFRFQNYDEMNNNREKNLLMMNSEILNAKPPADKEDFEIDVLPQHANSGSEFEWSFLWYKVMHFPASNALKSDSLYWLSARNVKQDHWEAEFDVPQKIDLIDIHWRLPPKRFRVFIKLDDRSDYIPVTEIYEKTQFITKEGKLTNQDATSEFNAILFHKPLYAKKVRINLNEPLKHNSFSIFSVKFYQRRTTILIKNDLLDDTQNYCFFVNSDVPRQGSKVEAYPCLKSLAMANNNEMWVSYNDNSIRHYNSRLCLGFDVENLLTLRDCGGYIPAYTIQLRNDNTLFFTGYNDKCIVIDTSKKLSANFISEETDIFVTSQADNQTFKKENVKFTGENYWHSAPGQKKATMQILFGKIKNGHLKGKFENKKIDVIKIDWIREPKKFMIYTWKPGFSWNLRYVYTNFKSKSSEIDLVGDDAAAIMLVMEESHMYEELNNMPAYAIREISLTYKSMAIKNANCADFADNVKVFDMDTQNYHKLENTKDYLDIKQKMSITFEKIISSYTNIKLTIKYIEKSKLKAMDLIKKIAQIKKTISDQTIKNLRDFKSEILATIKNSVFESFLISKGASGLKNIISHKKKDKPKIGTKMNPAIDCLSIKKLNKNALSGWYYIKTECTPKAIRVFCDFTVYGDAIDIFVFNDNNKEPNPDLSYLGIKDFNSIRYQCAKHGLVPLQINNAETVKRIFEILISMDYDLSKAITIPLGYDYSCINGKCSGIINSLNDKQTPTMASFFRQHTDKNKGLVVKPGPFVGLGYSDLPTMLKFDPDSVAISALICSTNHFITDSSDSRVKNISCDLSPATNGDIFIEGSNVLVECPTSCAQSPAPIYGNNMFHLKSSVCKASIHTGILGSKGGKVNVRVIKGLKKYLGSISNGIQSLDYDKDDGMNAFSIIKYEPKCPISLFKELAKQDNLADIDEANSDGETHSSFMETSVRSEMKTSTGSMTNTHSKMSSSVSLAQIKQKFQEDLRSNELEAVDMSDIEKAGIRPDHTSDLNKPDNDPENYQYNKLHNGDNNSQSTVSTSDYSDITTAGLRSDMINDVNSMVDYNNQNGAENNQFDINSINNGDYNYKFSQSENNSENSLENGAENSLENEASSLTNTNAETFLYTEKNQNYLDQTGKRDRLVSEDPNQKSMVEKMLSDIDKAKNNISKLPDSLPNPSPSVTSPPTPTPPTPTPPTPTPPTNPNNPTNPTTPIPDAPKIGQTKPTPPVIKPPKINNARTEPTTDDGNIIITKIRKSVDWEYMNLIKTKAASVFKEVNNYKKSLSWSNEGSNLSILYIKRNLQMIEKYKFKVLAIMKKLTDESNARIMMTKKLKHEWRSELNKYESKDVFKLNYSIDTDILIKKILTNVDAKSKIKSNWDVYKEGLKDRPRAIGITSNIFSQNQLIGSLLKIDGKSYYDFNLIVDVLFKTSGKAGVAFRMRDDYNYYAFFVNKTKGTKSLVKVINGRKTVLKTIKDGGILINNWHRIKISCNAAKINIHIYDIEQVSKATSEKIIELTDDSFSSGGIGMFVNKMEGFFFDNLIVTPTTCWTPWTPMKDLKIISNMSSVYVEDFTGSISEKFITVEPEKAKTGQLNGI